MRKNNVVGAVAFFAVALTACGGGGSSTTPTASAEGAYRGTISGSSTASAFDAVVLEDGQVWALYGNNVGGVIAVSGVIQGQGASSNGSFTSTTLKDFGTAPPISATLNATYAPGVSMSGTLAESGGSISLNGTAIPTTVFDYNSPAVLSNITGNWTLSSTSGNTINLAISANGTLAGTDMVGCALSGTVGARPSGKNIFNVQLTFGPAPCALAGSVAGGIAIYTTLPNGTHQLIVAAVDASRTYGSIAFGTR